MSSTNVLIVNKGGPGSGHRGHKGRPGKVGGGLPEGATSTIVEDKPVDIADMRREDFKNKFPFLYKAIGEAITIEASVSDVIVMDHLQDLDRMPTELLVKLKEAGTTWHISNKSVPYVDNMERLKGVTPRGWVGDTWDSVVGCYDAEQDKVILGSGRGSAGGDSIAAHETGHAIYEKLVRGTNADTLMDKAYASISQDSLPGYFKQPNRVGVTELFADSFGYINSIPRLRYQYGSAWADTFMDIVLMVEKP